MCCYKWIGLSSPLEDNRDNKCDVSWYHLVVTKCVYCAVSTWEHLTITTLVWDAHCTTCCDLCLTPVHENADLFHPQDSGRVQWAQPHPSSMQTIWLVISHIVVTFLCHIFSPSMICADGKNMVHNFSYLATLLPHHHFFFCCFFRGFALTQKIKNFHL